MGSRGANQTVASGTVSPADSIGRAYCPRRTRRSTLGRRMWLVSFHGGAKCSPHNVFAYDDAGKELGPALKGGSSNPALQEVGGPALVGASLLRVNRHKG